ncbi:MAG TPA: DNA repair protein RadA [Deltaproteobacteria bacterium]|nr:DNA repair protein RadA [Deltaproteobacteria bacterium]HOI07600.1 DNA repair protein RadA [Deltaproteobacteria bacterium]
MPKPRRIYRCSACGGTSPQWMGKCPVCGEWNTLAEDIAPVRKSGPRERARASEPTPLSSITSSPFMRRKCGIEELDRVLGGGVVEGSLVLIGGDPGIGKSTIMLQMASNLALTGMTILYVSGEESAVQLRMRSERLGIHSERILVYSEVVLEEIREEIAASKPDVVILDSIQSVYSSQIEAPPGSVSQIRECAGALMEISKGLNTVVFVVGHVTKEGWIAGPKMLEHMVDTVLYFEGDSSGAYRILRAVKNRFGTSGEIGVFEMKGNGLQEVHDPSSIFIHGLGGEISGSAVMATIEGSRAFVVEVQALVSKTSYSMPRRISIGSDQSRLSVLLAVLEKRSGVFLSNSDIVVNIAGGMKVSEPAVDLAVVMAVLSSAMDKPLRKGTVCIGEIGLGGELRPVNHMESRLREALRMGFTTALIPAANLESVSTLRGMKLIPVSHVREALDHFS